MQLVKRLSLNSALCTMHGIECILYSLIKTHDSVLCGQVQPVWVKTDKCVLYIREPRKHHFCASVKPAIMDIQYISQVTSWVHAQRGTQAREKLARVRGSFEDFRAKPISPVSVTIIYLWDFKSLAGPGTVMIQPVYKIRVTEYICSYGCTYLQLYGAMSV